MNPSDKYEQIKDVKRLNPVEQEAMVLKHEQQIKDLAENLLELKQSMEFKKEKKEWVGMTEDEAIELLPVGDWEIESTLDFAQAIELTLREKNNGR